MNIFSTSPDPKQCAINLDDRRLNKMITETGQIICTILHNDGIKGLPFKPTHTSHPVVKWADATANNLYWLSLHHQALYGEWQYRFNKGHGGAMPDDVLKHIPAAKLPTRFQNSAGNNSRNLDYSWVDDTHLAYQMYMIARWSHDTVEPKWSRRGTHPSWFNIATQSPELIVPRVKSLIKKQKNGEIQCPLCGDRLVYKDSSEFECKINPDRYTCLYWREL